MKYKVVYLTEKDSQVKALAKVLNAKYTGKWKPAYNTKERIAIVPLQGHVLEQLEPYEYKKEWGLLSEETLFVFPEIQKFKIKEGKDYILKQAKRHLEEAEKIVVATDYDAEGAAIAYNVLRYTNTLDRFEKMIPMGSINEQALRKALNVKKDEIPFFALAKSGNLRALIDWAEGISLSRALSYYFGRKGLKSIIFGGVKSPMLHIVVTREKEISGFVKSYYWNIKIKVYNKDKEIEGNVYIKNENGKFTEKIEREEIAKKIIDFLKKREIIKIKNIQKTKKKEIPPKLFDLASLQNEVGNKYGFSPKNVLEIAQQLYDYPNEIQTYPRTEVRYLKEEEYSDVPIILRNLKDNRVIDSYIIDNILSKDIPKRKSVFNDKEVVAHGAIIPTTKDELGTVFKQLDESSKKIFLEVAKRYVANFMEDYEYIFVKATSDIYKIDENDFYIEFKEHIPMKSGYKEIYDKEISDKIKNYVPSLDNIEEGSELQIFDIKDEKKETAPKSRYTKTSLNTACSRVWTLYPDNKEIKEHLKEHGIGTPATRSQIIEELFDEEKNDGEPFLIEKKYIYPTMKAMKYIEILPSKITSPAKRAYLSRLIKEFEKGKITKEQIIKYYKEEIKKNIQIIKELSTKKSIFEDKDFEERSIGTCPVCKKNKVYEYKSYYKCNNSDCFFIVYKNTLNKIGGRTITKKNMKNLLERGEEKKIFKTKDGTKSYEAKIRLKILEKEKKVFIERFFEEK